MHDSIDFRPERPVCSLVHPLVAASRASHSSWLLDRRPLFFRGVVPYRRSARPARRSSRLRRPSRRTVRSARYGTGIERSLEIASDVTGGADHCTGYGFDDLAGNLRAGGIVKKTRESAQGREMTRVAL